VPPPKVDPVTKVRKVTSPERDKLALALELARLNRQAGGEVGTGGTGGGSADDDGLDPVEVRAAVREVVPLLGECFEMAPAKLRAKGGRVVTEMKVHSEPEIGTIIYEASFPEGDDHMLADADFTECMHETLMSVEMPPIPEDGGEVVIRYPFTFSEEEGDEEPSAAKKEEEQAKPERQASVKSVSQHVEDANDAARVGEYAIALDEAEAALKLEPKNQQALTAAAIVSCNLKDAARAREYIERLSGQRQAMARQICIRNKVNIE
jgi:hypothetical protein